MLSQIFSNKNLLYLILKDTVVCDRNALCHTSKKMNEWIKTASEQFGGTHKHLKHNKCCCYRLDITEGKEIAKYGCIRRGDIKYFGYYAEHGWLNEVKYLIANGANVTIDNNYAVCYAARNGHVRIVKYLHNYGVNITSHNNYAIKWAANNGYLEVVRYLTAKGACMSDAICWAAKNGHVHIVKYLHKRGADITAKNNLALHIAAKYEHANVVEYIKNNVRNGRKLPDL